LETVLTAVALMLVIEGALPFAAPQLWREAVPRLSETRDGQIRFAGLASMSVGVLILMVMM